MKYTLKDNAEEALEIYAQDSGIADLNSSEIRDWVSANIPILLNVIIDNVNQNTIKELIKSSDLLACAIDGLDKEDVMNAPGLSESPGLFITSSNYSIGVVKRIIDYYGEICDWHLDPIEDILVKNMTDELVKLLAPYEDGREFLIKHKDLNSTITAAVNMHRLQEV